MLKDFKAAGHGVSSLLTDFTAAGHGIAVQGDQSQRPDIGRAEQEAHERVELATDVTKQPPEQREVEQD